jgi:hypothetical protein
MTALAQIKHVSASESVASDPSVSLAVGAGAGFGGVAVFGSRGPRLSGGSCPPKPPLPPFPRPLPLPRPRPRPLPRPSPLGWDWFWEDGPDGASAGAVVADETISRDGVTVRDVECRSDLDNRGGGVRTRLASARFWVGRYR